MSQSSKPSPGHSATVITGTFVRRKSKSVTFVTEEQSPPAKPQRQLKRSAKVARMLALAHHIQRALDQGLVSNRAAVARKLGLTEARVTQFMDLLYLAPDIQLRMLELEAVDGVEPTNEKAMLRLASLPRWADQSTQFSEADSIPNRRRRRL